MTNVSVQGIRDANQTRPLLPETVDLLESVRQRAFELAERRGLAPGHEIGDWLQAEKEVFRVPELELAESGSEFQIQLALPGFEPKDIRVAALPDTVIVEGKAAHQHNRNDGTVHVCEFGERRLFRRIPLPRTVDVDRVSAILDNGVLQVRAAKAEQQQQQQQPPSPPQPTIRVRQATA